MNLLPGTGMNGSAAERTETSNPATPISLAIQPDGD